MTKSYCPSLISQWRIAFKVFRNSIAIKKQFKYHINFVISRICDIRKTNEFGWSYVTLLLCDPTSQGLGLNFKLNCKTVPVLPSLIFLHLLPSAVNPAGYSFCFYSGFLDIFVLLSSYNNMFVDSFAQVSIRFSYIHSITVE